MEFEVDLSLFHADIALVHSSFLFSEEKQVELIARGLGCLHRTWQSNRVLNPTTMLGKREQLL